ncbi:hypothetical protein A2619_01935 [candidate division WWE3 bacterium RIFOXYD1_FULL_39_9]|uniref:Bacterial toxin RNase RnlA/LsoA DBD domain-containing protein n=1 Tax=candidate division WWE3 bacterium RIFOXYD1_FULL_39_9 TaxID=1802649 RepID=A0A1F4X769_UNCKA|nr:MAG: hypothetical protein A2619_01935 [candidate division WWE3 bacterium RIFOXYD1_FULL_39_9]
MNLIERDSWLWGYLQPEIQDLINDGEILIDFVRNNKVGSMMTDYSFIVFPFAKAYEGFLKKLFLDLKIIKHEEYYGDEIRIGRLLNPRYQREIRNVFSKKCKSAVGKKPIMEQLWAVWKRGRNLVFHYFPHNFRKLSYEESMEIVDEIITTMHASVAGCKLNNKPVPEDVTSIVQP